MFDAPALLAFAAVLALSLFFTIKGISPAFAPMCAIGAGVLILAVFGCLGFLALGAWVFYLAALAAGIFVCLQLFFRRCSLLKFSFSLCFFAFAGLFIILLLFLRRPMFTSWDEFSLWGTASKMMKLYNELYVSAPAGWPWAATQKPAAMLPGYLFQFFGSGFAPWRTYAGVDVFLLAMMTTVLAPLDEKRHLGVAFPLALAMFLMPFVFYHYQTLSHISPAYLDSLGDMPLGFAFAATLLAGLYGRRYSAINLIPTCISLLMLTLCKETGFALALVACVIFFADEICVPNECFAKNATSVKFSFIRNPRIKTAILRLFICLSCVFMAYGGWEIYLRLSPHVQRGSTAGSTASLSVQAMPIAFLKDIFSPKQNDFFKNVTGGMLRFFVTSRGNMLGSGLVIILMVWGILAASAFIWRQAHHRRRCLVFGLFSALGFVAWYALVTMSYLYILRPEQAFESYDRYVFPYYIGCLAAAFMFLGIAIAHAKPGAAALGQMALIGFAVLLMVRIGQLTPFHYTIFGMNSSEFNAKMVFSQRADAVRNSLDANDKTFLVSSEDSGLTWFMYHYEMLPYQMDYSYGGQMLADFPTENGRREKRVPSADEWKAYLLESGCTKVYIHYANGDFIGRYKALFADEMQAYLSGQTQLYTVDISDEGLILRPIPTREAVFQPPLNGG